LKRNFKRGEIEMNVHELLTRLMQENIPENCYSLEGGLPNDKFVLNNKGTYWEVYYTERGKIYELTMFQTEEEACKDIYLRIKNMMKYY
jgi:hypothetical protein